MSISISGGASGITIETDPTALKLTGGTLSGKLNATTTATTAGVNLGHTTSMPTSLSAGDVWITDRMNYTNRLGNVIATVSTNQISTISTGSSTPVLQVEQSGTGGGMVVRSTSATAAGTTLRVEQRGTGNAFLVEDATTPDSTAFVINQHGRVGIGVNPSATACLKIDATGLEFNGGKVITNIVEDGDTSIPQGWTAESPSQMLRFTINGLVYCVPAFLDDEQ